MPRRRVFTWSPSTDALFPPLPSGATLIQEQDFESGTVGQSFTANQCEATNNKIINDPHGGGNGKTWESWWDFGDPPVAGHAVRCEMSDFGMNAAGTYLYRLKFCVRSDSYLPPNASGTHWMYMLQCHGDTPSTSPPIAMFVDQSTVAGKFRLRFGAGDGSWGQTPWFGEYSKNVWHGAQVHVKWSQTTNGWCEFHVDGQPITVLGGGTRLANTKTLTASQGDPSQVYLKYGIDAGDAANVSGTYIHMDAAMAASYNSVTT